MSVDLSNFDVTKTCAAIGRYYASLGKEYNGLFATFYEENGLDEDGLQDELEQNAAESLLCDFGDDNPFPFTKETKDENEKKQMIFNLIKQCIVNPNIVFDSSIPNFKLDGAKLFELEMKDIEDIKQIYSKQCIHLWNNDWEGDQGLLKLLAVGKKHGFDYLLHLVDDYGLYRVGGIDKPNFVDSPAGWNANHRHFRQLEQVTVGKQKYRQLATTAVSSFHKRVCGSLQFNPMKNINDSLERTVYYIYNAVNFVATLTQNASKSGRAICPFHLDFCIISGAPNVAEKQESLDTKEDDEEDDDDEDDDDDDEPPDDEKETNQKFVDVIGNISKRLDGIKHEHTEWNEAGATRVFGTMFDAYLKNNDFQVKDDSALEYLHQKRLIVSIDRRASKKQNDKGDDIWMYEEPDQGIPDQAVPEAYINSSLGYVLPEIGANKHCGGSMLTMSFHVREVNVIKAYLFWNAHMIRFMPTHIRTVLPKLFNMKYAGNQDFIDGKNEEAKLDDMIKDMEAKLVDKEFDAFVSSYT
eukprot:1068636_1